MKLIYQDFMDITLGCDSILRTETTKLNQLRSHLDADCAQRLSLADREFRKKKSPTVSIIIFGKGFGIRFSFRGIRQSNQYYLFHCCRGILLIIFCALILVAVWVYQWSTKKSNRKRIPLHSIRIDLINHNIYPDLRTKWIDGLSGDIEKQMQDYPDEICYIESDYRMQGEFTFIQGLHEILDDHTFTIARFTRNHREDIDLILIGSKGIWVFEVKHWSGEIYWDDLGWQRFQTFYERDGIKFVKQPDIHKTPDQHWIRSTAQVRHFTARK